MKTKVLLMNAGNVPLGKADLEHGKYYAGTCRNASVARWNEEEEVFYHWRTKFGTKFIETIKCPEDEGFFDVFYAFKVIPNPDDPIPFD